MKKSYTGHLKKGKLTIEKDGHIIVKIRKNENLTMILCNKYIFVTKNMEMSIMDGINRGKSLLILMETPLWIKAGDSCWKKKKYPVTSLPIYPEDF